MKKVFIVASLIIFVIIGLSGCCNLEDETPGDEVREYFEDEYKASDYTFLSISTVNGAINVTSWTGENITLNATKRSRHGVDDLKNAEIIISENANELSIEIQHVQPIRSRAVDLLIKIPTNVTMKSASSTNGPIQITNTKGNSVLTTTNGPIDVEDADGYVKAITTNGGIEIKGTTGIDDLITTNGAISAEIFDILDDVSIQSTNGGITIYLKSSLNSSIQASTVNGDITVENTFITVTESSNKFFKGIIGSGGYLINIDTTNGGININ